MIGTLRSIWLKRMKGGPMDEVNEVNVFENKGLEKNANQAGKRQVTIMDEDVWNSLMDELNLDLPPVTRRANLMVRGLNLEHTKGKVIIIGETRIEIHGETIPCGQMDKAFVGLKDALDVNWRGGIYGVVLNDGKINVGDEVKWEKNL